ncbi:hypothetical protein Poly21_16860 [Allorhodopirellula heiligendammensis]|uniref:Uncharacterized protein n=1 Tax=Allorhodopirellula heiligendammensis TaxID=2714739 RepID=A0A5C6C4N4_9BACT|nr:hypothetical protein Poly21_16860 [Allorhodopirellula heiligendammensis]
MPQTPTATRSGLNWNQHPLGSSEKRATHFSVRAAACFLADLATIRSPQSATTEHRADSDPILQYRRSSAPGWNQSGRFSEDGQAEDIPSGLSRAQSQP